MKKVMSQALFALLWAVWTGLYWGFIASFGWLVGAVAGKWVDAPQGMWMGGAIGLGAMITVILGTSKLGVPFFAGCCGGGATGWSTAILWGASADLSILGGMAGFVIGAVSAIPKPYTSFNHLLFLFFLGALSGMAIALVAFIRADIPGWIIAHTIGLAMIGAIDGFHAPVAVGSRRIGLVVRLMIEWASRGALAGLVVATITEAVMRVSDAVQAKLVGPVCVSLVLFVIGAVRYEWWARQRKRLQH